LESDTDLSPVKDMISPVIGKTCTTRTAQLRRSGKRLRWTDSAAPCAIAWADVRITMNTINVSTAAMM